MSDNQDNTPRYTDQIQEGVRNMAHILNQTIDAVNRGGIPDLQQLDHAVLILTERIVHELRITNVLERLDESLKIRVAMFEEVQHIFDDRINRNDQGPAI